MENLSKLAEEPRAREKTGIPLDFAWARRQRGEQERMEEDERAEMEAEIAKLDTRLEDPDLYTRDPARATALSKDRAQWVRARETAEEAWLEASEAYEAAEAGTVLAG